MPLLTKKYPEQSSKQSLIRIANEDGLTSQKNNSSSIIAARKMRITLACQAKIRNWQFAMSNWQLAIADGNWNQER